MRSPIQTLAFSHTRWLMILASASLATVMAGCAGAHRTAGTGLATGALAPDDAPRHPNRNAQYTEVDSTPRLVPRPSAEDSAGAQPCEDRMLSVSEIAANVNGSYRSVKLAFVNRGATACKVGGYPNIALLGPEGGRIGSIAVEKTTSSTVLAEMAEAGSIKNAAAEPAPDSSSEIVLMPHSVAAFQIVWQSGPDCPEISRIEVSAPDGAHSYPIAHALTVCAGHIQITALHLDDGAV